MEQGLIRLLDEDLECTSCRWKKDGIVMEVRSIKKSNQMSLLREIIYKSSLCLPA